MEKTSPDKKTLQPQVLRLPRVREAHWQDALPKLLNKLQPGRIELDCQDWILSHQDLRALNNQLEKIPP